MPGFCFGYFELFSMISVVLENVKPSESDKVVKMLYAVSNSFFVLCCAFQVCAVQIMSVMEIAWNNQ